MGGILPNLGDFTKIQKEDYDGAIDLLVGGTPCQSYSIAGLRRGLADPRGNLALEFVRLAYRTGARWTVWENVPGVLSSGAGGDFASLLSLLCGWEVPVPKGGWGRCGIVANAPGCFGLAGLASAGRTIYPSSRLPPRHTPAEAQGVPGRIPWRGFRRSYGLDPSRVGTS